MTVEKYPTFPAATCSHEAAYQIRDINKAIAYNAATHFVHRVLGSDYFHTNKDNLVRVLSNMFIVAHAKMSGVMEDYND